MTTNGQDQPKQPLFQRIKAQNLLSFGPEGIDLELGPLNVLIGPNGSGKSNLLELFSLLQAAPKNLAIPVRSGGGISEWLWKGEGDSPAVLSVEVSTASNIWIAKQLDATPINHSISLDAVGNLFFVTDERIWTDRGTTDVPKPEFAYHFVDGKGMLRTRTSVDPTGIEQVDLTQDESVLSQRKDPFHYPEVTFLGAAYDRIHIYKNWQFGSSNGLRSPQSVDVYPRPLAEDFSNLGVFLGKLRQNPRTKSRLIESLRDVCEGVTDFELNFEGGTVQVYFHEGDFVIPANRLSDGSLRYLCLLAILLDPEPPAFIAIEEPELGIHPDLMPRIVDLLIDASTRMQLVVTTHNDTIVDALNDRPESIIVCEKHDGQTEFNRLDRADLKHWLDKYSLGDLWVKGALGGTRW